MFNGCRKVIIDDIRKDDVLNDMRQFVQFEASKQDLKLSDECIQCICLSSNGCYLYVQLYFQVCLPNHLIVCNKPTLPVTLNGLFYTIFTIWFDRLNTIAQCTVRRLFSLLLSTATFAISIDEARSLLMNQTHLGQLPDIVNQLQHMQLIHVQQEPRPESFKDFWVSTAVQHRSADSSTPDTPKVLHDSLQAVIRAQHNPMLRWLSDVKHCGLRFHCTKALGHLLYVLHNPITQNGFALAHHVQAASSGSLMPNLQAFLFLIYCHPNQLSDTFSSTTSPSEFLMGPQTLRPQLHPLIVYIESCAQVNTTRLFVNDDSNPDHTEAELISEMLGDLQSGDVQFPTGSFEIASEQSDLDMNNNCVPIAQDSRDVAAQWPSTALIVKPNWAINNNLNILQPPKEVIPPANCLNPKLIFEPCQMDPSSGTFDMQQLLSAITGQDENLLKMLLDSCPHLLYSYDDRGLTPLLHAIHVDCADSILRLLVSYDLDINQPSEQLQLSPLMLASARDRLSSVDLLLEMDADVHAKDTFGRTALACAVRAGSSAGVVELLITWGSRADECDHFGRSLIVLTVIGMCTWSSCTIASAESTNNPPDHSITSDSNNMVTNHDSSKPDYFQKKQKPATLSSTGRTDANQLKVDAKRKSAVNPAAKMRGHISRFPNTGKGKRHSLIECVPQFRANRVMTGSATAAQATWVRASQMLEPNNAPVRPNTSFEHRLLRTLFNHHRSNVANIDANGVSSSDVQQRELNVLQVIRQLVDGGADVEQSDHGQRTTLHWAAAAGTSPLLLNYLIQLVGRRQLQQPDVNGWLPVHWAAATGQVPLLKTLSTDGLLHQLTTDRLSVLACAVRSNQFDAVISLVRRCGARLDQVDAQRRSVVNWVVGAAGVRLRWLRRQRASAQRHKSRTASCCTSACAASDGKSVNEAESIDGGEPDPIDRFDQLTELPSKLLDPLVDSIDDEVQASLDQLSLQENEELELPDEDADEESEDDDEEGEGEEEGEEDEEENADRLEDSKEDDEQYRRRVRMLKLLIALGADLNFRDSNGRTALHLAAWLDDAKVTQLLLSNAALVDPVDSDGRTPLYFCAVANSLSTARLLLAHRARLDWLCSSSTPGSADTNDRSILSVALRQNRYRFVRLLLRSGRQSARNDPQSMIGWSQLVTQVAARSSPKWKSLFSHYGYKC